MNKKIIIPAIILLSMAVAYLTYITDTQMSLSYIEHFIITLISTSLVYGYFSHIHRTNNRKQLTAMRSDGLSDTTIKGIVGEKRFKEMEQS